jgi:prepilin-type processing-associated H-X9-DG protein
MQSHHDALAQFPAGYQATGAYSDGATDTAPGWGWGALILPYLEAGTLYNPIRLDLPIQDPRNSLVIQSTVSSYLCPSDLVPERVFAVLDGFGNLVATAAPSSYSACVGGDESDIAAPTGLGVCYRNSHTRSADIVDGTSWTIIAGERSWANARGIWAGAISSGVCQRGEQNPCPGNSAAWYPAPALVQTHGHLNNATTDTDGGLDDFSSQHPRGSNFLLVDGSVHFLRSISGDLPSGDYTPDSLVLQALSTRANVETIPGDWVD